MRVHGRHNDTLPLFPNLFDEGINPATSVTKKQASSASSTPDQPNHFGCLPIIIRDPLTISGAISTINSLSQQTRSDLVVYSDRVYKSAIQSAYKATASDKERLEKFIDALSFLFKKNEIARALTGSTAAQIEAVIFASKKLQQAYRRRGQSKEKQMGDLTTSRNYGRFAKELESLFYLKQQGRRRRAAPFKTGQTIGRELIQIAASLEQRDEMARKLNQGSNMGIQAVWILNLKHNIVRV